MCAHVLKVHVCLWDILFAMTDTTASTNEWLIYFMVNHPEVQAKVHKLLDQVLVDHNGHPRWAVPEDQAGLEYLWWVIKEVMRMRLISPVMAPHYASEDVHVEVDGSKYRIPAGSALFLHGYAMSQDPSLWGPTAHQFDPDRWGTAEHRDLDLYGAQVRKSIEHYKFTPFSLGKRMCPGYGFAKVSTFMQAAGLLQGFEWSLSDAAKAAPEVVANGGKLDLTENWGLTIMPKRFSAKGWIKATPRANAPQCDPKQGLGAHMQ
jgi:cytochrome P450